MRDTVPDTCGEEAQLRKGRACRLRGESPAAEFRTGVIGDQTIEMIASILSDKTG